MFQKIFNKSTYNNIMILKKFMKKSCNLIKRSIELMTSDEDKIQPSQISKKYFKFFPYFFLKIF